MNVKKWVYTKHVVVHNTQNVNFYFRFQKKSREKSLLFYYLSYSNLLIIKQ
ncbi:hypothetical protein NTHI1209_01042 [Haemophilus influenzae]|uniref:Uncharacterized protein n=1 Tax=Haemophilus influenzae TaxID=727 RepID=A0A158SX41_HAEIF|nr:hypothetical protein NTHI1209_01042 [Haemophilus influenzae]